MNTSNRWRRGWNQARGGAVQAVARGWAIGPIPATVVLFTLIIAPAPAVFAAGIEHPDVGTIAIGRGGAYAAAPSDGLAIQYNPAGFASQTGWRLTLDGNLAWQKLTFAPALGGPTVSNANGAFLVPAGAISYGFGAIGPLSGLTLALGGTGPSAIGKERYPSDGAQRYALTQSDYLIGYASGAVAASFHDWLSAGVTLQMVKGTAKFSQAVWSGTFVGTDPTQDSTANIDVSSPFIPTAVFGISARPVPRLALGLSYRPRFDFLAHGSLTTVIPQAQKDALGIEVTGTQTDFFVSFPDVIRFGAQYEFTSRLLVEADVVAELWSRLHTIEIRPQNIRVSSASFNTDKPLGTIVFQKDFEDAVSLRIGGDYIVLPGRLTVRAGYLHETSAIPTRSVSVDFGNWQRDAISFGGSVQLWPGVEASIAYAHHFMPDQHVSNSQVVQVTTPCVLSPDCSPPAASVVGNGVYTGSLDVASLSLRLTLDDLRQHP
jgi:long-subunit fatty acid transport protein